MRTETIHKTSIAKDLAYYLSLPYTTILRKDEEGDVVARIDELPGCIAHGQDETEALQNVATMKQMWLEDCLQAGDPIPEPEKSEPLPSGKWVQRVPRSLHAQLVRNAKVEGVSLNQLVTSMLSQQLNGRAMQRAIEHSLRQAVATLSAKSHHAHFWDSSIQFSPKAWLTEPQGSGGHLSIENLREVFPRNMNVVYEPCLQKTRK